MANQIDCPKCGAPTNIGAKFCGGCGNPMQLSNACPQCSAPNDPGARFCGGCGLNLHEANEIPEGPGYVVDGEWHRAPGEFARVVSYSEMESTLKLRKSVQIPRGSVGVMLQDGRVLRDKNAHPVGLLQPGRQTTMGWFNGLWDQVKGLVGARRAEDKTAFYLVDLRPTVIPLSVDISGVARRADANVRVVVYASFRGEEGRDQADAIESFVAHMMQGAESFTQNDVRRIVHPVVEANARAAIRKHISEGMELESAEAQAALERALNGVSQTRDLGFHFAVEIALAGGMRSIDIHLGKEAETPAVKSCAECGVELPFTASFCAGCGARQQVAEMRDRGGDDRAEAREIFTSDGQQVEVDVVLRIHGAEGLALQSPNDDQDLKHSLASAASKLLRRVSFVDLATPEGFQTLETALSEDADRILSSMGLRAMELALIDVRSKGAEWVLGARADMEQHKVQLELGHEWVALGYSELELKELNHGLTLKNMKADSDFGFHQYRLEHDDTYQRHVQDLEQGRRMDAAIVADREARQELLSRDLAAFREETAHLISKDALGREADRSLKAGDREDQRTDREFKQQEDAGTLQHQAELEKQAAQHRLELERKAREQQQDLDAREADAKAARKLEKLRAMQELAQASRGQKHTHEREIQQGLLDSGLSEAQMLAAQAGKLSKAEHGAAFAKALGKMAEGKAESASQEATIEAYRTAAEQAVALSQSSMEAMSQVASEASTAGAPRVVVGKKQAVREAYAAGVREGAQELDPCTRCGAALGGGQFCTECGTPRE